MFAIRHNLSIRDALGFVALGLTDNELTSIGNLLDIGIPVHEAQRRVRTYLAAKEQGWTGRI